MSRRAGNRAKSNLIPSNPSVEIKQQLSASNASNMDFSGGSNLFGDERNKNKSEDASELDYLNTFYSKKFNKEDSAIREEKEEDLSDFINDNSDFFGVKKPPLDRSEVVQPIRRKSDVGTGRESPFGGAAYGAKSTTNFGNYQSQSPTNFLNPMSSIQESQYFGEDDRNGRNQSQINRENESNFFNQGQGDFFQSNTEAERPRSRRARGSASLLPTTKVVAPEPDFSGKAPVPAPAPVSNLAGSPFNGSSPGGRRGGSQSPTPNQNNSSVDHLIEEHENPNINPVIHVIQNTHSNQISKDQQSHFRSEKGVEELHQKHLHEGNVALAEKLERILANIQNEEKNKAEIDRLESELTLARKLKNEMEEFMKKELAKKDEEHSRMKQSLKEEHHKNMESLRNQHQDELKTHQKIAEYEKNKLEELLGKERQALKQEVETKSKLTREIEKLSLQINEMNIRAFADSSLNSVERQKIEDEQHESAKRSFERLEKESVMLSRERARLESLASSLAKKEVEMKEEVERDKNDLRKERDRLMKELDESRVEEMKRKGEFFKEKAASEMTKVKYEQESASLKQEYERKQADIEARSGMLEAMEKGILELQRQTDLEVRNLKEELDKRRKILEEDERKARKFLREVEMAKNDVARAAENVSSKERLLRLKEEEVEKQRADLVVAFEGLKEEAERVSKFKREFQKELERIENERLHLEIERSQIGSERFRLETEKQSIDGVQKTLQTLRGEYLKNINYQGERMSQMPIGLAGGIGSVISRQGEALSSAGSLNNIKPLMRAQTSAGPVSLSDSKITGKAPKYFSNLARDYEQQLKGYTESISKNHEFNQTQKLRTLNGNFF